MGLITLFAVLVVLIPILFALRRYIQVKNTTQTRLLAQQCPITGESVSSSVKTHVLVIIAHPDDEAMFFVPVIRSLKALHNTELHLLCLSTGNADGIGELRKHELAQSSQHLGFHHVQCIDDPRLPDGMKTHWAIDVIRQHIAQYVSRLRSPQTAQISDDKTNFSRTRLLVISFDGYGISGHVNHIAVSNGVKAWTQTWGMSVNERSVASDNPIEMRAFELNSLPIGFKYFGPLSLGLWYPLAPFHQLTAISSQNGVNRDIASSSEGHSVDKQVFITADDSLTYTISTMELHASQFVWYRRLFVRFALYSYVSPLTQIAWKYAPTWSG